MFYRIAFLLGLLYLCVPPAVNGQHPLPLEPGDVAADVACTGVFRNQPAEITGRRVYRQRSIKFVGTLRSPMLGEGTMIIDDYQNQPPYDGYLHVNSGPYRGQRYRIQTYEKSNGQWVIEDGRPTLMLSEEWGLFTCQATPLRAPR